MNLTTCILLLVCIRGAVGRTLHSVSKVLSGFYMSGKLEELSVPYGVVLCCSIHFWVTELFKCSTVC
jgi:hypothetical protein